MRHHHYKKTSKICYHIYDFHKAKEEFTYKENKSDTTER